MNRRVKGILCFLFVLTLVLCVGTALCSREAYAWDRSLSGSVNASDLEEGCSYALSDDASIYIAEGDDITITGIYLGYHTLVIEGSDKGILRIESDGSNPAVKMETPVTSSLVINGGHVIINADVDSDGSYAAVGWPVNRSGSFCMYGGIVDIQAYKTGTQMLYGINCNSFAINAGVLNIDVSSPTAPVSGLTAEQGTVGGGLVKIDAYSDASGKNAKALNAENSGDGGWEISGGSLLLNGKNGSGYGYGMYVLLRDSTLSAPLYINGGFIYAKGSYRGINIQYSRNVDINGSADITAYAEDDCGFYSTNNAAVVIEGSATVNAHTDNPGCAGAFYAENLSGLAPLTYIRTPVQGYWNEEGSTRRGAIVTSSGGFAGDVCIELDLRMPAESVGIDDDRGFPEGKNYWVKGSGYSAYAENWNARYEPESGTLYLRDYDGGPIYVDTDNVTNKKLTIDLSGTNKINKAGQFGIYADKNDLEITSTSGGRLEITGYASSGSGAAIATHWQNPRDKKLTISGSAEVYIDISAKEEIRGISSGSDIIIKDHAIADVNIAYGNGEDIGYSYGVMCYQRFIAATDKYVNVSVRTNDPTWSVYDRGYALTIFNSTLSSLQIANAEYVSFSSEGGEVRSVSYGSQARELEKLFESSGYLGYGGFRSDGRDTDKLFFGSHGNTAPFPVTGAYFPDFAFREFISDHFDTNGDGWLDSSELSNAEAIEYVDTYPAAYSVEGVELLGSLKSFEWNYEAVRTLDLSNNPLLEEVYAIDDDIDYLNIEGCTGLVTLDVRSNELDELDVTGCPDLDRLDCSWNIGIEYLDLSGCPNLTWFAAEDNENLTGINFGSNKKMKHLDLNCCYLSELDVSGMTDLELLDCNANNIDSLDVSKNRKLRILHCQNNDMGSLTLASHPDLLELFCYGNEISDLDISGAPDILYAYVQDAPGTDMGTYVRYGMGTADLRVDKTVNILTEPHVNITSCRLALTGKIGIRIYFNVPDSAKTAKIFFEDVDTHDYPADPAVTLELTKSGNPYYNASEDVFLMTFPKITSRQMTLHIKFVVYDEDGDPVDIVYLDGGFKGKEFEYCAADWANRIILEAPSQEAVTMAKALLNFGGCAQKYLNNYNPEHPANPDGYMTAEMAVLEADPANDMEIPAAAEELGLYRQSLELASDTAIRLYFNKPVTVKVDGKDAKISNSGSVWLVTVEGINSRQLDHKYEIVITGEGGTATVRYSALSWANKQIYAGNENSMPTAKALYLYNQAAKAYIK